MRQPKAPFVLPCGTVVQQFPEANGSWYVRVLPNDREMTESEWLEFCWIIRKGRERQ